MRKKQFSRWVRARGVLPLAALLGGGFALQSCTDLGEQPFSSITPDSFYRTDAEVRSGMASVYTQLAASWAGGGDDFYIASILSDEFIIPVRGQDWFDNGVHLEAQRFRWTANSPLTLRQFNGAYNSLFTGVARANSLLAAIENVPLTNKAQTVAELRTLRAYFYWRLMDNFGGVPIAIDPEIKPRERSARADVFKFVESEILASRADLPVSWPAGDYGRVTRGAADAILASVYLNAQVYTGTVSAAGLQKGPARWQDAITAADRVLAGPYRLETEWAANFRATNNTSPEQVFVISRRPEANASLNMLSNTLHYNSVTPRNGNNGWSVEPTTYRKLSADPTDKRTSIFLVGPQVNLGTGAPTNDRSGARLVFTVDFRDITQATEGEGVRFYKWPLDPARVTTNNGNDFGIIRLAEIYLIKAEALNELGQTGAAIDLVNTIRARVFTPAKPLSLGLSQAEARTAIFDERQQELFVEGKRRTDLIRAGNWTNPWYEKPQAEGFRMLLPIPQVQIDVNPLLTQNPGY